LLLLIGELMKRFILILVFIPVLLFGQNVSQIELHDVKGNTFKMGDHLDNDGTVIIFWATWCVPCKKEFPKLQVLKEKFNDKDIQIIAVSKDSPRSLAKVKRFVKTHKYDFTNLFDPDGEISAKLLVTDVPHTMLVDTEGKVTYNLTGYRKGDEVEIEKALLNMWKVKE